MFRDDYTNFSFNEQDSSSFKVWITNKNDLKRNMSPNFSDKFNTPTYGGVRYHDGTTIDKQDFKFSCVAIDVTLNEWRAITEWLSPLKKGKLRFDWNNQYYYMVKLSKAPSGTMFMKGRIDSVMGQLHIISFDLEFTTIEDWAALGEYGEQKQVASTNDISISVFNNPYYMPTVIEKNRKVVTQRINGLDDILFGGYEEVQFKFESHSLTENEQFAQIKDLNNNIVGAWIYKDDSSYYHRVYLDDRLYIDDSVTYLIEDITSDDYFTTFLNSNHYIVLTNSDVILNFKGIIGKETLIVNASSLPAYPIFYTMGKGATISYKGREIVKYQIFEDYINQGSLVESNSKNFTLTSFGKPLEVLKNNQGFYLYKSGIINNNDVQIESGRPELLKCIYFDYEVNSNTNFYTLKFKINNNVIYNRFNPYVVHIFDNDFHTLVNTYHKDQYGQKSYYANFSSNLHAMIINPIINIVTTNQGSVLELTFANNNMLDNYNIYMNSLLSNSYINKFLYLSICDYDSYQITVEDGSYATGLQLREVI